MKVNVIKIGVCLIVFNIVMLSQDSKKGNNTIELTSDEAKELLLIQRDIMNVERQISSLIENRARLVEKYKASISKVEKKYSGTFNETALTVTKTAVNTKDNKTK